MSSGINGFSIFTLIVFFVVNILVIFPITIPIPRVISRPLRKGFETLRVLDPYTPASQIGTEEKSAEAQVTPTSTSPGSQQDGQPGGVEIPVHSTTRRVANSGHEDDPNWTFHLDLTTAPVIGILLLLASTSIDGSVLRNGIVGTNGVKPYDIMTLFISLAYISLSLDCTGLLRFLAFTVALKGGKSGPRLFLYFYLFFFLFGTLVGNDPIILSGTPFIAYYTRAAGIDPPTAWIFSQFASSNVASAVLVSSNPTNLVLTGAFGISFLVFSAWTVLPVLATGIVLFPLLLWVVFREEGLIPKELEVPDVNPREALTDPHGAVFGSVLLGVTLAALVGLSAGGLLEGIEGVWTVTAPAALVMVVRDILHDAGPQGRRRMTEQSEREENEKRDLERHSLDTQGQDDSNGRAATAERGERSLPAGQSSAVAGGEAGHRLEGEKSSIAPAIALDGSGLIPAGTVEDRDPRAHTASRHTLQSSLRSLSHRLPTFSHIFVRLPFPLLPFAFSMFILVEALAHTGWITVWAGWWTIYVDRTGLAGAIFMMGLLSVVGCNIFGTNIGATILLSSVLQTWSETSSGVTDRVLYGSVYTLAIGSNYGAFSYVFSASLAGLLWRTLLEQKNIHVSQLEFARRQWLTVFVCMVVGCLIVAGEVCVIYK